MTSVTKALLVGAAAGVVAGAGFAGIYYRGVTSTPRATLSAPSPPGDPSKAFKQVVSELKLARDALYRSQGVTGAVINENEQFLLQTLRDYAAHNSTSPYNFGVYNLYSGIQREYLRSNKPTRVLEIGPGNNLGVGLIFALSGAEKYYGLDIYMDPELFAAAQYESIAYLLELAGGARSLRKVGTVMTVKNGKVEFAKERLEYLFPRQSYDIPISDGSLDYVFSHATLEHVADPDRTIQSIHRVLRKGGVTAHQIDMRDHADFSKPLEFLKVDEATWKEQWKDPKRSAWHLNRWRLGDFEGAFQRAGFHILKLDVNATFPVEESLRRTFDARFQKHSLKDLSATGVMIIARKE
jgi:SAM-dependent methyltransferase